MPNLRSSLPGFTLIELMIYLTLLGLIAIGVFSAYNFFVQSSIQSRTIAELQDESRTALDPIRNAITKADSVSILTVSDQDCAVVSNLQSINRMGLEFSSSEQLSTADYHGPDDNTSRSISFWMVQSDQSADANIIGFGDATDDEKFVIYSDSTSGAIHIDIEGKELRGSTDVVDGNWHHVMVTFDNLLTDNFSALNTALYIDGKKDTITASNSDTARVDTDNASVDMTIGGYDSDSSFEGQLASVKIWHRALNAAEVWPEVLSVAAADRDDLVLELKLDGGSTDTSPSGYTVTGFSDPTYTSLVNQYANKTTYAFAANPDNPDLFRLWSLSYIDTSSDQSENRCTTVSTANGWVETSTQDWTKTDTNFFSQSDGVTVVNAEAARSIGESTISVGDNNLILTGQAVDSNELCKIAPAIAGFNTGNNNVAEAVIRIDDDFFEADVDDLKFFDAVKSGPTTATINGDNTTYYTYKNIKDNGVEIWSNITAEYVPDTGVMRVCTSTGDNCTSPNLSTTHGLSDWEKVFRNITYAATTQTYQPEKNFLFTLGGNIPCRLDNYIACRNINNDDFDDNITSCYHYYDFVYYDDLGSDYACHSTDTHDSTGYTQCLADWEDARAHASSNDLKMFGLEGYLATITTSAEHTCTDGKIAGAWGWIGASDRKCERDNTCGDATDNNEDSAGPYGKYNSKDTEDEGYWYWVTGPEGEWTSADTGYADHDGGDGEGLYFGTGLGSNFSAYDPPDLTDYTIPEAFTNWANNQPNDWVKANDLPTQDYLQTYIDGLWNDDTSYDISDGFLVEYGGLSGDPRRILTKRTGIDTFAFLKNCN